MCKISGENPNILNIGIIFIGYITMFRNTCTNITASEEITTLKMNLKKGARYCHILCAHMPLFIHTIGKKQHYACIYYPAVSRRE